MVDSFIHGLSSVAMFALTSASSALMLSSLLMQGIILCQYVPCTSPATCANTGVPRFYYAQVPSYSLTSIV